ncbi:MAG TPA: DUF4388 domain-containing protein [Ktedonobacteraceae bacterium]
MSSSNQDRHIIYWSNSAMPQQPTTLTDRLANVIQVIQLGRKTGTLTVERSSGNSLEHGSVSFVNGLMTQASAHQLRGLAAFQWLNTWGSCRFTFTLSDSALTTNKLPSLRPGQPPASEHESFQDTDPTIRIQAQAKAFSGSGAENNQNRQNDILPQKTFGSIPNQVRSWEDAVQRMERMKFTRAHRRLFLLIDGHRTTTELAHLMGRRQVEVYALLHDLERADVVKL